MGRELTAAAAKRVYDRIGGALDWAAFYENDAISSLVGNSRLGEATAVLELGCGSGRLAGQLLAGVLPLGCRYVGLDVSPVMVRLARQRLDRWGHRAEVKLSDGGPVIALPRSSVDRFLSTYVFDIFSRDHGTEVLAEATRVLVPGGLLCLVSLTWGDGRGARLVSRAWEGAWRAWPALLGGCRPVELFEILRPEEWRVEYRAFPAAFGVTSEVVVAVNRKAAP